MKVGFIGLGRMGQGMAARILGAGNDLVVYNRSPEKAEELVAAGARLAPSVPEACAGREVVAAMVADDAALLEISLGAGGVRDSLAEGALYLVMGTHGVRAMQELATAHAGAGPTLVAAPVLGRPEIAAAGQLGIVAAGPPEAIRRCEPLFAAMGRRTFVAGDQPEAASATKLANNFVLGCAIEVIGEAFSLVRKYGVGSEVLYEVMTDGLFSAPAYKVYGRIIVDEDYEHAGFTASLGLKDANLVLAAADAARLPLPSANVWRDRLLGAIARGEGEKDWAIVAREQARAGGLD